MEFSTSNQNLQQVRSKNGAPIEIKVLCDRQGRKSLQINVTGKSEQRFSSAVAQKEASVRTSALVDRSIPITTSRRSDVRNDAEVRVMSASVYNGHDVTVRGPVVETRRGRVSPTSVDSGTDGHDDRRTDTALSTPEKQKADQGWLTKDLTAGNGAITNRDGNIQFINVMMEKRIHEETEAQKGM